MLHAYTIVLILAIIHLKNSLSAHGRVMQRQKMLTLCVCSAFLALNALP